MFRKVWERFSDWFTNQLGLGEIGGPSDIWMNRLVEINNGLFFTELHSSCFSLCHYNAITERLWLRFKTGPKDYHFDGVPFDVFKAFISAPSHGKFYHTYIKGRYQAVQLSGPA